MDSVKHDYRQWSNTDLIARIESLETQLQKQKKVLKYSATYLQQRRLKSAKASKPFDPSKYNTRFIALKFAYLGQRYNGFEHHANNTTPLPTIEEEMWKALVKTKLIFKEENGQVDWEGCEYSKCGRTDKGVSAFGQVIGIRVRSSRPKPKPGPQIEMAAQDNEQDELQSQEIAEEEVPFDDINDELPYPRILNRVLPPDIRVLAWCPSPPEGFSARFSCRERRYRYFFTQPCFTPLPGPAGVNSRLDGKSERDGWLNIEAMQEGASHFIGSRDFRNFCKLDQSKQISNFERLIRKSEVRACDPRDMLPFRFLHDKNVQPVTVAGADQEAKVYCFEVHGSAFLWHQIRHMIAILFLVGQGFEPPSIVRELLDITKNPRKPVYEMADDAPLVLWDCIFPDPDSTSKADALNWLYPDDQIESKDRKQAFSSSGDGRFGPAGINEVLWAGWRRAKMDEILAAALLDTVASQQSPAAKALGFGNPSQTSRLPQSARVFEGGNSARPKGVYVPIMKRERMDSPEVANKRWLERKETVSANNGNTVE